MAQYDNTCKVLVEQFTEDIARWLLGEPIALTTLEPTELLADPISTDSLILLESENLILHIEFQVTPKPDLPFRMLDYRVRGHRRYPQKQMRQVIIYLRSSPSPLVYQDYFELENLFYRFQVMRLWEQPTEGFLQTAGLLPFAVLTHTIDRETTLQQVNQRLLELSLEVSITQNLIASTTILAGLLLDEDRIRSILRRDVMRESSVYQAILAEGRQEGRIEGLEQGLSQGLSQGRTEEALKLVRRQLQRRLAMRMGVAPSQVLSRAVERQLERLSLWQLEDLGEVLLEFEGLEDLQVWLTARDG